MTRWWQKNALHSLKKCIYQDKVAEAQVTMDFGLSISLHYYNSAVTWPDSGPVVTASFFAKNVDPYVNKILSGALVTFM